MMADLGFLGGFIAFCALVIGLLFGTAYALSRESCRQTAEAMGVPHAYVFAECMIRVDRRLVPLDAYKVVRPAR